MLWALDLLRAGSVEGELCQGPEVFIVHEPGKEEDREDHHEDGDIVASPAAGDVAGGVLGHGGRV